MVDEYDYMERTGLKLDYVMDKLKPVIQGLIHQGSDGQQIKDGTLLVLEEIEKQLKEEAQRCGIHHS